MSHSDLIPGIKQLTLVDGAVFVGFEEDDLNLPLELKIGQSATPLEPVAGNPIKRYPFGEKLRLNTLHMQHTMRSEPPEATPGDVYAAWLNKLEDWALTGKETLQVMLVEPQTYCTLILQEDIVIPPSKAQCFFYAQFAGHRAHAQLVVTIKSDDTEETKTIALDPMHQGGQLSAGYQQIAIPLPRVKGKLTLSLSLDYMGYKDDGTGTEPFLFLADLHVGTAQSDNSILKPYHSILAHTRKQLKWMAASFPCLPDASDSVGVALLGTDKKQMILKVPAATFSVRENFGHTLILEAQKPSIAVLCVDGKPVLKIAVSAGDTIVRIPSLYLNGTVRHLAFKDETGSFIWYETQQVLPSILTPADIIQREAPAPFPTAIFAQTPIRYAGLQAQMKNGTDETDFAQIAYALSVLEGGYDRVKLKPLNFPKVDKPDVSIIIPAHNKVEVTYLALCSLLAAYNEASFEVIVVDDASTDETATLETFVSGISVIHNPEAQRFIRACNAGAEAARGEYIVLLNNDVEVTTGWLDELIAGFSRFKNVGLTGSKLLYPNGDLQDAGGIIWGTGNPWNYGNRQNAMAPRFSYARQADYLSGAAMMVPAKLWHKLGGLSSYLEPMYFEDTDFAFKVRDAGYTTWFVPSSIVYHYEGMTSGTDTSTGFKAFQEVNRPKFKRQWAKAYSSFGKEGQNPDLEKDRGIIGRVLFIDYTTPRGDQDAGSYAALQEIRLVQSMGYKVTFLPINMAYFGKYTEELQKMGVEVIYAPFYMTPGEFLDRHINDFDAAYITRYYVAQDVLGRIRSKAPNVKILFNNADLHFLREIRTAKISGDPEMLTRAKETRTNELQIINQVDVVLSYNEVEHSVIEAYTDGAAKIVKCPWVIDIPKKVPDLKKRRGLSFLGSFKHHPNAEAVKWFAQHVMPLLSNQADAPVLSIYGSGMTDEIKSLETDLIKAEGFVADIADAYDMHRIFVAPLLSGAGIKGKVLSALGHGIPCLLTPTAAEGIGLRSGHDCFILRTPQEWAEKIQMLNKDDDLWAEISKNARNLALQFSFQNGQEQMRQAFETAGLYKSL